MAQIHPLVARGGRRERVGPPVEVWPPDSRALMEEICSWAENECPIECLKQEQEEKKEEEGGSWVPAKKARGTAS
ncbi:unnamed protein product [Victoria cruziana]